MNTKFFSTKITGIGKALPEKVIKNSELEEIVDTNDEWISSRSGIKERRVVNADETGTSLATKASSDALKYAGINSEEVELIICATSLPDNLYPSTACEIQRELNCPNAAAFDITAACSGFVYALNIAKSFIATGVYKNILIASVDVHSRFINWEDRSTCVLFGDGAGAMVVSRSNDDSDDVLFVEMEADGFRGEELKIPLSGKNCPLSVPNTLKDSFVYMNGREIYKFAVNTVPASIKKAVDKAGISLEEVDSYILHQANVRIIEAIADRLKQDREKFFINLHKYGNTSAASIPIAMTEAVQEGFLKKGSTVVLSGFGAGLTWGTAVIRWNGN